MLKLLSIKPKGDDTYGSNKNNQDIKQRHEGNLQAAPKATLQLVARLVAA